MNVGTSKLGIPSDTLSWSSHTPQGAAIPLQISILGASLALSFREARARKRRLHRSESQVQLVTPASRGLSNSVSDDEGGQETGEEEEGEYDADSPRKDPSDAALVPTTNGRTSDVEMTPLSSSHPQHSSSQCDFGGAPHLQYPYLPRDYSNNSMADAMHEPTQVGDVCMGYVDILPICVIMYLAMAL